MGTSILIPDKHYLFLVFCVCCDTKCCVAVDGRPLVIRSCGWVDPNDGGRSACNSLSTPGYIHQEYCSICNSEACNSAPRPAVPLLVTFAAPLAALAAWLRR